jgi:hypothetical protein
LYNLVSHFSAYTVNKKIDFILSNSHSTANLSSGNFANGRIFRVFRVDVVTRHTRRHWPSHVTWTRQIRRHSPSRVSQTLQTRERQVWQVLCEFSESGEFGECRLDRFMHIKNVICAKNNLSYHARFREPCCMDSPDSPTFAESCCTDLPDLPTLAEPCCADLPELPTLAEPCSTDSPDLPTLALASF